MTAIQAIIQNLLASGSSNNFLGKGLSKNNSTCENAIARLLY